MKPILFSAEMVRAIQDLRKTQTRRIVKPKRNSRCRMSLFNAIAHISGKWFGVDFNNVPFINDLIEQPKCKPGDILWVRETWAPCATIDSWIDDKKLYAYKTDYSEKEVVWKWHPSIFMPREAVRIFLRVTNVRVERLHDITENDARNEGVKDPYDYQEPSYYNQPHVRGMEINKSAFAGLWDSLNAKRGYGWQTNCWVWVYEFERVSEA